MATTRVQPGLTQPLSMARVIRTWWPLAASWLLMSLEQPVANAIVARLADPEVHLAAWGGVVFPLILIIEAPIIMLLAASTALSKDWEAYRWLRRFMMWVSGALTVLHILVAFTPLYYPVVVGLIDPPPAVVEPARLGLMIMTPWTWAIAFRRFNQGVLIRFGHSGAVGVGTAVRLGSGIVVLIVGYSMGTLPGIAVASMAIATGVVSEALYAGLRVRPVLRNEVRCVLSDEPPPALGSFLSFYVPLSLTSVLYLLVQPLGSAALSRMPSPLESLATWPVVSGLIFLLRSVGIAYTEVVVALLGEPQSIPILRRFAAALAGITAILMLLIAATPLALLWLGTVSALKANLLALALPALWIALPMPALTVLQSWFQGALVHSRKTRGVSEAMAVFLVGSNVVLWGGVLWGQVTGLCVGLTAFTVASLLQTAWLWWRSRPVLVGAGKALPQAPIG